MSKSNEDFFKTKREWSKIKDNLLGNYLPAYFSKVLMTRKPIIYIDCFAGNGKFDDGSDGSPRIALRARHDALINSKSSFKKIKTFFIEAEHFDSLKENILDFVSDDETEVIPGKYEEEIKPLISSSKEDNIFLYIDPYGIKNLNFQFFNMLAENKKVEFLMNFNTFGFIRAGLSALKINYAFDFSDDLVEIEPICDFSDHEKVKTMLNIVAGGSYWQDILIRYKLNQIDMYSAEKEFSREYINELKKRFKYVLNMPIRLKESGQPKYRMIYGTNHEDGCFLMAQNISKQTDKLVIEIQNKGQGSLFEENIENEIINTEEIGSLIFNELKNEKHLKSFIVDFINDKGMLCKVSDIVETLKDLEKKDKIQVTREPSFTDGINPKPTRFWEENKEHKIIISRK